MAGFMKNAMSYLGMSDVVDDEDDYIEEDEEQKPASKSAFDSDHTVTPLASTTAPAASSTTKPFPGGRVNRITTIHPKSYEDAQLVGRALRDGVPVVLNLTGVAEAVAYRIVDFSAGVVFGVRGRFLLCSEQTFHARLLVCQHAFLSVLFDRPHSCMAHQRVYHGSVRAHDSGLGLRSRTKLVSTWCGGPADQYCVFHYRTPSALATSLYSPIAARFDLS